MMPFSFLGLAALAWAAGPQAVIVPLAPTELGSSVQDSVETYSQATGVEAHRSQLPAPADRDRAFAAAGRPFDTSLDELARDKIYLQVASLGWPEFSSLHPDWEQFQYESLHVILSHGRR